jgi:hypothetical protein
VSRRSPWLFSAPADLALFGGTAVVALLLVALAPRLGLGGTADAPAWTWVVGVLLVDVAHVWSTALVVYLDPHERARRPALYAATPVLAFAIGVVLYQAGEATFWRALAYVALFHFVRQQYGWVRLYRARASDRDRLGAIVDGAMIYAATLVPVAIWHARLPREFAWFRQGDFVAVELPWLGDLARGLYVVIALAYVAVAVRDARRGVAYLGKHLVVATTAACWWVGIVATNSDYAFTVTNVFIHGVPYLALVVVYVRTSAARDPATAAGLGARVVARRGGVALMLGALWLVAYLEELVWDRGHWHEHGWLFGGPARPRAGGAAGAAAGHAAAHALPARRRALASAQQPARDLAVARGYAVTASVSSSPASISVAIRRAGSRRAAASWSARRPSRP